MSQLPRTHVLSEAPRLLDLLHWASLVNATTQTTAEELAALERYATGARRGEIEIGTYQGSFMRAASQKVLRAGGCYIALIHGPRLTVGPTPVGLSVSGTCVVPGSTVVFILHGASAKT